MTEAKIEELKGSLESIRNGFKTLSFNQNEINQKYSAKIAETTEGRVESLNKWHEDEIESAERLHAGQLVAINNDVEKQQEVSKKRVFEVLLLKKRLLGEKLPKAAQYFNKFKTPFLDECKHEEEQKRNGVKVQLQNHPILPQEEITKMMEECAGSKPIATASEGELSIKGEYFRVGSQCIIKIEDGIAIPGAIKGIEPTQITFLSNEGSELSFTVNAINIGLVEITK